MQKGKNNIDFLILMYVKLSHIEILDILQQFPKE